MITMPPWPRWLGLAGLLPQAACLLAVWLGPDPWVWTALAIGWGYAALIFSFLGGMWWGIGAAQLARGEPVPAWVWVAAVVPSLLALVTFLPWIFGQEWPGPSLGWLGVLLIASPLVDRQLRHAVPAGWMRWRMLLSGSLGVMTLGLAAA